MKKYQHLVQYYETDQMGIVHHSNYIRWMEEARIHALEQIGVGYKKMEEQGVLSPVIKVSCEYKNMSHFYDTVAIEVHIKSYNGVKLTLAYRITESKTRELRAYGESTHCFIDREGHPVSLKRSYPEWDALLKATSQK